ncbi:MAG: hypothetical protein ACRC0G_09740 [Fusobacteriaceae bacterium]
MLEVLSYEVYGMERAMVASGLPMATDSSIIVASEKRMSALGNAKPGSGHNCALKGITVVARVKYPLYWTKQFQRYHFADIVSSQSTMHRVTKFNLSEQCNEWVDEFIISVIQDKITAYNHMEETKTDIIHLIKNDVDFIKFYETDEKEIEFYKSLKVDWEVVEVNKKDLFMEIISCLPSGFEMEMEITTNYLQLQTIHQQRKYHKLPDWQVFCSWIESLPKFKEFCLTPKN